jgi:hypothetical protein
MSETNPQIALARLALAALPPDTRAELIREHTPHEQQPPARLRLWRVGEASKALGRSRTSLWRCIKSSRIRTVQLREGGVHLIPDAELRKLAGA